MRSSSKSAAAATSLTSPPKPISTKRQRKSATASPLGDVTNLLLVAVAAETPTPTPSSSKSRRTARLPLSSAPSDVSAVSSTCSSSASVTLLPKPSVPASATPARKPSAAACVVTPARKRSSTPRVVTPAPKPSSAACFVTPAAPKPSSAACFVTPAPKPSSAAVIQEERGVLKSPAISTVYRRTTEAAQGRWRRNPNSKGKEPVAAATASCRPPHGKSARTTQSRKKGTAISPSAPCHEGKKKRSITITPSLLEDLLEKQRAYFADIDAFELIEEEASESELE